MPKLTFSPIQLVRYTITDVAFRRNLELDPDAEDRGDVNVGVEVERFEPGAATVDDPQFIGLQVNVTASVVGDDPADVSMARESGHVRVLGAFAWAGPDDFDEAQKHRLLHVNGLSLLYGIARTLFVQLSDSGGLGPVMLPTVGFQQFADDEEAPPVPSAESGDPAPAPRPRKTRSKTAPS